MVFARPVRIVCLLALFVPALAAQVPSASDPPRYALPPKDIVEAFDAPLPPTAIVSPSRQVLALEYHRNAPGIAELAQPFHRLAGLRINPKTNGPHRTAGVTAITFRRTSDGTEVKVATPTHATFSNLHFSPDGARLSFLTVRDAGIELWTADVVSGAARVVSGTDRINAAAGDPCDWLKDSVTIVCLTVPAGRGPEPQRPQVPAGPNVQENYAKAAPAPTYEDLLKDAHDEALFEHYFTSQLVAYDVGAARKTSIGRPAVLSSVAPSPNGEYLLVSKAKRPYSHLVPLNGFAEDLEVWSRRGETVKTIAELPSAEGVPLTGVRPGPRAVQWRADQPATVVWSEALDGGDPKNKVPFRDRVVALAAPFTAAAAEIGKTEWRFSSIWYTDRGVALLTESDRTSRRTRTWAIEPGAEPRKLWDYRQDAAYQNPGTPLVRGEIREGRGGAGRGSADRTTVMQTGDFIYVTGSGSSPEGDRPFLDRVNLKTQATERLFRSAADAYETVLAPLSDDANRFITRHETPKEPPNYYTRSRDTSAKRPVTTFPDPQPELRGVEHQFVTYTRKDGVTLSATLYTPPGYKKGDRVPLIVWAYPREFGDAASASQITGSPNRFTLVSGYSHLFLLLSGYAILDDPTMPIIGSGETANDTYVEQLVSSAEAAIDKVVAMGVADRDRIGVGGHSYGAFMTANLLAHSRLFRAGFAESGAYNRSLTPFGFQSERRTFWEVPDLYAKMSPFWYAHQVKDPILLMHGEADDNSGTFPIQSERFYMALKGHGATVRYVTLPYEAHGYAARETLLHVLAERIAWFDRYVKNAPPRMTSQAER